MNKFLINLVLILGAVTGMSGQTKQAATLAADISRLKPSCYLNMQEASGSLHDYAANVNYAVGGAGTVLYHQPGYDKTNPTKYGIAMPNSSYFAAPSNSLCDFDWYQPFSVVIDLPTLDHDRTSTSGQSLVSKGSVGCTAAGFNPGCATGSGWAVYLQFQGSTGTGYVAACFLLMSSTSTGAANGLQACTPATMDLFNGYKYQIVAVYNGNTGMSICVNGVTCRNGASNGAGGKWGAVNLTLAGGTGYAASTPFTSTGGGTNCVVTGTMTSSSGVPASVAFTTNGGCTSLPTINLTGATGTGVTVTPTLIPSSISSATTFPLRVGQDVLQLAHSSKNVYVDTVAVYNRALSQTDINSLFTNAKWYQSFLGVRPTLPIPVIYSNDGCADNDNLWAGSLTFKLAQLGYTRPIAVINNTNSNLDNAAYRNFVGGYGMAHIPVGIAGTDGGGTGNLCNSMTAWAPNIPAVGTWKTDAQVVSQALNTLPAGQKAYWIEGGSYVSLQKAMTNNMSQFANKVAAIYAQAGNDDTTTNTHGFGGNAAICKTCGAYVFANSPVPYYQKGSANFGGGPGTGSTRANNDVFTYALVGLGDVGRAGWDNVPVISIVVPSAMGVAARGTLSVSGSNETFTLDPAGLHYNQSFTYNTTPSSLLYQWFVNGLSGTLSQPLRRR